MFIRKQNWNNEALIPISFLSASITKLGKNGGELDRTKTN